VVLVQRPAIELTFRAVLGVDRAAVEAERFGVAVRNARRFPALAGGVQGLFAWIGEQRIDRGVQLASSGDGVLIGREHDLRVVFEHGPARILGLGARATRRQGQAESGRGGGLEGGCEHDGVAF
jgi:hypothetical protein